MGPMSSADAHAALVAAHGPTLCHLALDAIDHGLVHRALIPVDLDALAPMLREPWACFVTLSRGDDLRGSVGTPSAVKPLAEDLVQNAYSAAFEDPHHPPLLPRERIDLSVTVAVLSRTEPLRSATEGDLLRTLRPGIDGLLISDGRCRALHLPSAWGAHSEPQAFLQALKRNAGMAREHWSSSFSAWRFTASSVTLSPDGAVTPSAP